MDFADLLMNYPIVRNQTDGFMAECGSDLWVDYQVKWKMPRFFPFTIRADIRYLPSLKDGKFKKVLSLAIRA